MPQENLTGTKSVSVNVRYIVNKIDLT